MTASNTILLADDSEPTREFLADNLIADGYHVLVADSFVTAIGLLSVHRPDLVVLDVNGQTLELLDAVRSGEGTADGVDPGTPVIVLTANNDELHRVRLLERGGDDVVRKPFAYPELRARIAALLRRSEIRHTRRIVRAGPIVIDVRSREVRVSERRVELSDTEYRLLVTLAEDPTRVFTREELLRGVWGLGTFGRTRTLDSHASRLRRKLCDGGEYRLVINVWGVGFRLIDGASHPVRPRSVLR